MPKKFEQFLAKQLLLAFVRHERCIRQRGTKLPQNVSVQLGVSVHWVQFAGRFPQMAKRALAELQILVHSCKMHCESFTFALSVRHNDFCLAQKISKPFSNGLPKAKLHKGNLLATFSLPNAAALLPVSQSYLVSSN